MATWQFDFHMIPSEVILHRYGTTPIVISRSDFDQDGWWEGLFYTPKLADEISKIVPQLPTWKSALERWGYEDGNRIEIMKDGNAISSILVRIDVRTISLVFIKKITDIAQQYKWLIRISDGRVLQPSSKRLLSAIHASDAYRFVEDPQSFFEAAKDESNNGDIRKE
jgi:hypothetical protein